MNSFLTTLAVIIVAVLALLFIGPRYVDWNRYKDVFELHASNMLGRSVKVNGDVNLRLLPKPYVQFESVRIAGDPTHQAEDFVTVQGFTLWLSVAPLLQGQIQAQQVELVEPHFNIRIDQNGRGNWQDIGNAAAEVPFLPKDVTLDKVSISNGKISFSQALSLEPVIIDKLYGELSATSLLGPYNFSGYFDYRGERRNLRFSSAKKDNKGALRIKSFIEAPATASRYAIEGDLKGLGDVISLEGVVEGEMPIDWLAMLEQGANFQTGLSKYEDKKLIEIKSKIVADLKRIELSDLAITINDSGKPQSIKGSATLDWEQGLNLSAQISANSIDFDEMLGDQSETEVVVSGAEPVKTVRSDKIPTADEVSKVYQKIAEEQAAETKAKEAVMAAQKAKAQGSVQRVVRLFSGALQNMGTYISKATVKAEMTEAKLGGSQLMEFNVHLTKDKQEFKILDLNAELPGRNKLHMQGKLTPEGENLSFSGPVKLQGASLGALSHWVLPRQSAQNIFQARPYNIQGQVEFAPGRLDVSNLKGELNGSALTGLFKYNFAKRKEFVLELDSQTVDLSDVFDQKATLRSLLSHLLSGAPSVTEQTSNSKKPETSHSSIEKSSQEAQSSTAMLADMEGKINLRIGSLKLPTFSGKQVIADGKVSKGQFSLNTFSIKIEDSLAIKGQGEISNLNENAVGNVTLSVDADDPKGVMHLFRQLDLPGQMAEQEKAAGAFSPLKLSVTMALQNKDQPSTDIVIAGDMANSKLSINARHEGSLNTFGQKQLDISGTLTNPDSKDLIRQLARGETSDIIDASGRGAVSIQASGVPEQGIETRARMDAGPVQARYNGSVKFVSTETTGKGDLTIKSSDAAAGLAILGFKNMNAYAKKTMDLSAQVKKEKDTYEVVQLIGAVGGLNFNGKGSVSRSDATPEDPYKITAQLTVNEASLPAMMSYLLPSGLPSDVKQIAEATNAKLDESWSKNPFDTHVLKMLEGNVTLKFSSLDIALNESLKGGELQARFFKGGIEFKKLTGGIYGGKLSSSGQFAQENGPMKLSASVSLKDADLAELFKNNTGSAYARGEGDLQVTIAGQGLSPLGLVSVLNGEGKVSVRNGEVFGFSPNAIADAMAVMKTDSSEEAFTKAFKESLKKNNFPFKTVNASLDVKAGTINIQKLTTSSGQTSVTASALIELPSLKLDSEWQVQMRKKAADAKSSTDAKSNETLPGVTIVFAGQLGNLSDITPMVNAADLQRVLAVKKMEEDVKTLEKLNANDPETIRRLTEQKRLQEQKQQDQAKQTPPQTQLQSQQPQAAVQNKTGAGQGEQGQNQQQPKVEILSVQPTAGKAQDGKAQDVKTRGNTQGDNGQGGTTQRGNGQEKPQTVTHQQPVQQTKPQPRQATQGQKNGEQEVLPWLQQPNNGQANNSRSNNAGNSSQSTQSGEVTNSVTENQNPNGNHANDNHTNGNNEEVPGLTTLGTIDDKNNTQGVPGKPYTYVQPQQGQNAQQQQDQQNPQDKNQGANDNQKKKEEPSFFERLFGG